MDAIFKKELQDKLSSGISKLNDVVSTTYGPLGRNVILAGPGLPTHITKDGVTVANALELEDPIEAVGANLIKAVASKTGREVGDATTTATILASTLYLKGLESLKTVKNIQEFKTGIEDALHYSLEHLDAIANKVSAEDSKDLYSIAMIASNQDKELSQLLADTFFKGSKDMIIEIEESSTAETTIERVDGYVLDKGYMNTHFCLNGTNTCTLKKCRILVVDGKIESERQVLPALNECAHRKESILIVCDAMEPKPLTMIINNVQKGLLQACVVYSPGFCNTRVDKQTDLCLVTGSEMWDKTGQPSMGYAEEVTVSKLNTIIKGGAGDPGTISQHIEYLHTIKELNPDLITKRINSLTNGLAKLKIAGNSDVEIKEKIDRADDTIRSLKSVLEEGYTYGAGWAFAKCYKHLSMLLLTENSFGSELDYLQGVDTLLQVLTTPTKLLVKSSGVSKEMFEEACYTLFDYNCPNDSGWDVLNSQIVDLSNTSIIDSVYTIKTALKNAVSVATALLTTDALVFKQPNYML